MTFDPVPDPVPTPSPGANSSTPSPRPPPYGDGVENHPAPAPRPDNQKEHHMNTHENHPEQPTGHDADSARDGIGNAPGQPDPELKPLLGLATTELLIRELLARAEVSRIAGEAWPSYRTVDAQPASIEEVLLDHRSEWADYFERWTGEVGP